jgi:hypothetical protein
MHASAIWFRKSSPRGGLGRAALGPGGHRLTALISLLYRVLARSDWRVR